jgi:hypothetical protein
MADSSTPSAPLPAPLAIQQSVLTSVPMNQRSVLAASPMKQQDVANTASSKIAAMGGFPSPRDYNEAAIGRQTGAGVLTSSGLVHDLQALSYPAIQSQYGSDADQLIRGLTQAQAQRTLQAGGTRDGIDAVTDAASGFGLSTADLVGGIANFGVGLASPKAAVWGSNQMSALGDWVHGTQSHELQVARQAEAERAALAARDNEAQFEHDSEKDGSFVAGLKRVGRGFMDGIEHTATDSVLASDATFSGLGSLLTAGPMAKVIGLGAAGIAGLAGPNAAKGLAALGKILPNSGMAALAVQEGTSAFNEAVTSVANMPQEELDKSPYYQNLITQGLSPDDARAQTARNQGLMATGPAALGGMAMSKLTGMDKVIHNPIPGLGQSLKANAIMAARETAFEGGQSGTSTLSRNFAAQNYAEPHKALSDDVGEQMAQGAIAGLGGAGVTEGPSTLAHIATSAARNAAYASLSGGRILNAAAGKKAATVKTQNEFDSPVADDKVRTAADAAATMAPEAEVVMKDGIDQSPVSDEQKVQHKAAVDNLMEANRFDPKAMNQPGVPDSLKTALTGSKDNLDAIHRLAGVLQSPDTNDQDRMSAALTLTAIHKQLERATPDVEILNSLPQDHEARQLIENHGLLLKDITKSSTVRVAMKLAQDIIDKFTAPKAADEPTQDEPVTKPITEETLATPEGQQAALNGVNLAHYVPERANQETNNQILALAKDGKYALTDEQRGHLEASNAILNAAKAASDAQAAFGHTNRMSSISDNIQISDNQNDPKLSAMSHVAGITQSVTNGNFPQATKKLADFGEFVKHMSNKIEALNQHYEQGGGDNVPYEAIDPKSREWYTEHAGQAVHPTQKGSIEYAQTVALEAQRLADVHNGLAKAYPALNAKQIEPTQLNQALQGKAGDVAKAFQTGERVRPLLTPPVVKGTSRLSNEKLQKFSDMALNVQKGILEGLKEPRPDDTATLNAIKGEITRRQDLVKNEPNGPILAPNESKIETKPTEVEPTAALNGAAETTAREAESNTATAEPETTHIQKQTDSSPAIQKMDAAYPELLNTTTADGKVVNWFKQTFSLPKEPGTRIQSGVYPFDVFQAAIYSENAFQKHLGSEVKTPISDDVYTAYMAHISRGFDIKATMQTNLNKWLQKRFKGDLSALLANPEAFRDFDNTKIVNITEEGENGTLVYNPHLLESAILAGLQWILTAKKTSAILDVEAVAKIFGITEAEVTNNYTQMNHMNESISHTDAVRSLAQKIEEYWGLKADPNMPDGLAKGIPEAMAKEIIRSMIQNKMLQKSLIVRHADESLSEVILGEEGDDGAIKGIKDSKGKEIDTEATDSRQSDEEAPGTEAVGETLTDKSAPVEGKPKSFNRLVVNKDLANNAAFNESLGLIDKAILVQPKDVNFFGKDPIGLAPTQMNNRAVKNSPEQLEAIKKNQDTEHLPNMVNIDFYHALGVENTLSLFGAGELDPKLHNNNHLQSLKGQNIAVQSAFNTMVNLTKELKAEADTRGVEPQDLPVRWAFNFSKVGRLQMLGRYNPQASKLMRELFLPTRNILDLSGDNKFHTRAFGIAIGQALGVKVHTMHFGEIVEKTEKLREILRPTINLLKSHLYGESMPHDVAEQIKDNFAQTGEELTPVAMHALMDLARIEGKNDLSAFETHLYVEADGVSNGPMNGMVLLATGAFTGQEMHKLAKGGLFSLPASHGPTTMNEQRSGADPFDQSRVTRSFEADKADLYQTGNVAFDGALNDLRTHLTKDAASADIKTSRSATAVLNQMHHLLTVMGSLIPAKDLAYDPTTKKLTVSRGIMKNPLTITLYGSGNLGIANKLMGMMLDELYSRLSKVLKAQAVDRTVNTENTLFNDKGATDEQNTKAFQNFMNSLGVLRHNEVRSGMFGLYTVRANAKSLDFSDLKTFKFTKSDLDTITKSILNLFVEPMAKGIRSTVGDSVMESSKTIISATSTQSIFLKYAFQREIATALAAKKAANPQYASTDFLSRVEQEAIFKKLSYLFPFIKTGEQTFYPAGQESSDVTARGEHTGPISFSADLAGRQNSAAFVYGPSNSGVGGMPMLVIGMGDGSMMQYDSTNPNGTKHNLPVFDGNNGRISTMDADGKAMNEAVAHSWQNSPLIALNKTFSKFMESALKEPISDAMAKELARALGLGKTAEDALIHEEMVTLAGNLKMAALSAEARIQARAEFNFKIDQMAAAGSNYETGGREFKGTTYEDIAGELNEVYEQKLAKLIEQDKATSVPKIDEIKPTGSTSEPETKSKLLFFGSVDKISQARVLTYTSVNKMIKTIGLPPTMQKIFDQIRLAKAAKDYKIVVGSKDELRAYAVARDLDTNWLNGLDSSTLGNTRPSEKTIYLFTGEGRKVTDETLVHELIHAATFETIHTVMQVAETGQFDKLNPQDREITQAVNALSALRLQFQTLDTSKTDAGTRTAYDNALDAISHALNDTTQDTATRNAIALNEFMAWGLANQKLAALQEKTTARPWVQLLKDTIASIKKMFFGRSIMPAVANDMLSNLLFNTSIIVRSQPSVQARMADTNIYMNQRYGNDERLAKVNQTFHDLVTSYLGAKGDTMTSAFRKGPVHDALFNAGKLAKLVGAQGFHMTPQESTTFELMVGALATAAHVDLMALSTAQELYVHVVKTLTPEMFMPSGLSRTDPEWGTQYDLAQRKQHIIVGKSFSQTDKQGRSVLLPVFLGLAAVNTEFRNVLAKMPMPKGTLVATGPKTLDGVLGNAANFGIETLSRLLSGTNRSKTIEAAADALLDHIETVAQDRQSIMDQFTSSVGSLADRGDQITIEVVSKLAEAAAKVGDNALSKNTNKLTRLFAASTNVFAAIASETRAAEVAKGITAAANNLKGFVPIQELITQMVGRSGSNVKVYDMVKQVKQWVSQARQNFREHVPAAIGSTFKTKPTSEQWSAIGRVIGGSDLAAHSHDDALRFLKDRGATQTRISELEDQLKAMDGAHFNLLQAKMKQLANFMNTGDRGRNLLRNAEAVARLLHEKTQRNRPVATDAMVQTIDHLVSLYALEGVGKQDRESMISLVQGEPEGMAFVMAYLAGLRKEEMINVKNSARALLNHEKGNIPALNEPGVSLIIAEDGNGNFERLREQSYIRVADYKGSAAETNKERRGYYYAPISARSAFNQGVAQNVRMTAGGVDRSSGFSTGLTGGLIVDKAQVKNITLGLMREGNSTKENLQPIFDDRGNVVAYERSVDPNQLNRMNQDTHMARMLGVWKGRQLEESMAGETNRTLANNLLEMYKQDMSGGASAQSQYVNVLNPAELDAVQQDAIRLLSKELVQHMQSISGKKDTFYVRKDMLNDAFGTRNASIGDAWSGISRWSPAKQAVVKNLSLAVWGNGAYSKLVNAERMVQEVVRNAKTLIVVKSMVVPAYNFTSNIAYMVQTGVPITYIARTMPKKLAEVEAYTKSRLREVEADAELLAAEGARDILKIPVLKAELQSIRDSHTRLSIWPLLQQGELNTVSDPEISQDDLLLSSGKLEQYIEKLVDKLPGASKTLGRYAIIGRDTALFKGLVKAVEYGDFLAKAVVYDHLTEHKGQTQEQALGRITEEFMNYDVSSGRFRTYLESVGLAWFYNYKIRAVKVAISQIRNNPFRAMIGLALPPTPLFGNQGTPLMDNLFSKALEGKLGYTLGPAMGFQGLRYNPIIAMLFG